MVYNFLSILVRTHKRPKLLRKCLNSLNRQTKRNFVIVLISDCKEDKVDSITLEYPNLSFIISNMNRQMKYPLCNDYFNKAKTVINSDYVIFIDDDDEVMNHHYCEELENISIKKGHPAVIMSRSLFPGNKIIPNDQYWNNIPVRKHVSGLNFCIRHDIYMKFDWPAVRAGDYYYIDTIFKHINWKKDVYWHNKVTTVVTHIGLGRDE